MFSYNFSVGSGSRSTNNENDGTVNNQIVKNDYRTRGELNSKNSTFEGHVEARDDIDLTNVTALRTLKTSMGSCTANDSRLNSVVARDNINLTNSTARDLQSSMGEVEWRNNQISDLPADDIMARDDIKLTKIMCRGKTESKMGDVIADDSSLNVVVARDDIKLTNSTVKSAESSTGDVIWNNRVPSDVSAVHIQARDKVVLTGILCHGTAESKMDELVAVNSALNTVIARDKITLTDSSGSVVRVSMGDLVIKNPHLPGKEFIELNARDNIIIDNIRVRGNAVSSMGKFKATDCNLNEVTARDAMTLDNSAANSVNVEMGPLTISCTKEKMVYRQIRARDNITLENLVVLNPIKSELGKFAAINCTLPLINACGNIALTSSACHSASLRVNAGCKGIISLKDSVIEGDLIIELSQGIGKGTLVGTNRLQIGGMTVNQTYTTSDSSFMMSGVTDFSLLKYSSYPENSIGTINGTPYIYVKGQFIPLAIYNMSSESKPEELEIEIQGNGTIKGNIIFKDCKGKVTVSPEIKMLGTTPQ